MCPIDTRSLRRGYLETPGALAFSEPEIIPPTPPPPLIIIDDFSSPTLDPKWSVVGRFADGSPTGHNTMLPSGGVLVCTGFNDTEDDAMSITHSDLIFANGIDFDLAVDVSGYDSNSPGEDMRPGLALETADLTATFRARPAIIFGNTGTGYSAQMVSDLFGFPANTNGLKTNFIVSKWVAGVETRFLVIVVRDPTSTGAFFRIKRVGSTTSFYIDHISDSLWYKVFEADFTVDFTNTLKGVLGWHRAVNNNPSFNYDTVRLNDPNSTYSRPTVFSEPFDQPIKPLYTISEDYPGHATNWAISGGKLNNSHVSGEGGGRSWFGFIQVYPNATDFDWRVDIDSIANLNGSGSGDGFGLNLSQRDNVGAAHIFGSNGVSIAIVSFSGDIQITVDKRVAGVATNLATVDVVNTTTAGSIRLERDGNNLSAYYDLTSTDTWVLIGVFDITAITQNLFAGCHSKISNGGDDDASASFNNLRSVA